MTWQALGWVIGFVMGDFTYTLMGWASGVVLSIIVSAGCVNIARLSPFSGPSVAFDFLRLSCFDIYIPHVRFLV